MMGYPGDQADAGAAAAALAAPSNGRALYGNGYGMMGDGEYGYGPYGMMNGLAGAGVGFAVLCGVSMLLGWALIVSLVVLIWKWILKR